jgi:predicted GTPase
MFPRRILIMGAAGRDFHNFNTAYRDRPEFEVVAFTAAQIPGIAGRRYPAALAGKAYPSGIPILPEEELAAIIREKKIDEVVFSYSDLPHDEVMHRASIALAAGADFGLLGPNSTMLPSRKPVIAICAVRTGVGKSQVARWLGKRLRDKGYRVAAIRHPMPYGDLEKQAVQRFGSMADIDRAQCTIEEREEYEPHVAAGNVIYAGVDYARILESAEKEADIILWDGGNNDFSFIRPDLSIALADPLRPGHEATHHPGEAVLRMADIVLIAKTNSAENAKVQQVTESVRALNPKAAILRGASNVRLDDPSKVTGKRAVVIDDGPTLTHGGMSYGAGYVGATDAHAAAIIDPRPKAVGRIAETFAKFPHLKQVIPAMGYSGQEIADLAATVNALDADVVVAGSPIDLTHLASFNKPVVRARYDYAEASEPGLGAAIDRFLEQRTPRLLDKAS